MCSSLHKWTETGFSWFQELSLRKRSYVRTFLFLFQLFVTKSRLNMSCTGGSKTMVWTTTSLISFRTGSQHYKSFQRWILHQNVYVTWKYYFLVTKPASETHVSTQSHMRRTVSSAVRWWGLIVVSDYCSRAEGSPPPLWEICEYFRVITSNLVRHIV